MLIPHQQLSAEALQSLIEDVVTRDGTDYGEFETALAIKVAQVKKQLDQGVLVIFFNHKDDSIAIIPKEHLPPNLIWL
jgi:uncharacterized protein YheU (UPF0270 family)